MLGGHQVLDVGVTVHQSNIGRKGVLLDLIHGLKVGLRELLPWIQLMNRTLAAAMRRPTI
jgi:hypothetical protein